MAGKHKDKGPRHVRLCHYMMDSQAWKSLGAIARAIYPHIAKRYAGVGSNNGRIGYSVREAAAEFHIGMPAGEYPRQVAYLMTRESWKAKAPDFNRQLNYQPLGFA